METLVGSSEVALSLLWNSNPYITKRTMLLYKNPPTSIFSVSTAVDSVSEETDKEEDSWLTLALVFTL